MAKKTGAASSVVEVPFLLHVSHDPFDATGVQQALGDTHGVDVTIALVERPEQYRRRYILAAKGMTMMVENEIKLKAHLKEVMKKAGTIPRTVAFLLKTVNPSRLEAIKRKYGESLRVIDSSEKQTGESVPQALARIIKNHAQLVH
ncbi:TPA: hypothetical protein HA244_00150 [Candidatus Micrarchaeota archaeon]|nr:hypothetical protein [Candidatus Micrarchaeota archaeon]